MHAPKLIRPLFAADTYRALLFLAAAVPVGAAALALLIAGWTTAVVLAITPLVVPVLVGFRGAVGLLARGDAELAAVLLHVETTPRVTSGGTGYWRRGTAVLADAAFWRQQAYLAVRMTAGFAVAVAEISFFAAALGWAVYPFWYRWGDLSFGSWNVDTLVRSFVVVPAGIVGVVAAAWLARLLGAGSATLARMLLDDRGGRPVAVTREARRQALRLHAGAVAGIGLLVVVVWLLASRGYFWPAWVLLPLGLVLAIHGWVELVSDRRASAAGRGFAVHAGVATLIAAFLVAVWALTGHGSFWPEWALLGFAILLALHAAVAFAAGRRSLSRRVDVLESTRSGAVDAQDAELRRIEHDLHDGAQARLVALGMSLGMAEQKLETDPAAAQQLVTEARLGIGEALRELRDLARGIHPPVLSDRGLEAALATLADRSALPVSVSVELPERPGPAVETAAYFVAAEALANAAKHADATGVEISVRRAGSRLAVEIADDGQGGADPAGSGLTGLRRRVEALDGTLVVTSPRGGPTLVRAELPCAS